MADSPRIYVFHGPDGFSAREALRQLREDLQVTDPNVVRLDGKDAAVNEIASACQTATFFAEPRLVIIENLSRRGGGRRRSGATRSRRSAPNEAPASELDVITDALTAVPETTTVVLLDEQAPAGLVDAIKSRAKVAVFGVKNSEEIRRWADARVKERGASISREALERLCELVDGHHLGELAQEIDKLITYTEGRRIETADVEELSAGAIQHQTWDLTDAVIAGRPDLALRVLQRMDEKDHPPQLLLSAIVRQYRQVMVAQALLREGAAAPQIGERLGINHPFPLGKVIDQASRYPADRLERAYRRLLETDAAVKTGVMDIDTALDLLIVDLAEIANAGRRRPPEISRQPARRY